MLFRTAAVLACLGLAKAVPTMVVDDAVAELISRQSPNQFRDKLPGCGEDPSYASRKSDYQISQGKKVPKVGKDDACGNKAGGKGHCWTEYWIVESEIEYNDWVNSGSAIDCNSTTRCSSTDIDLGQTCESYTVSKGEGGDWKVLDAGFEYKVFENWSLKASSSYSYKFDESKANAKTVCTSQSARNQCTWEDDECHQVWYAQRDVRLYGYSTRVCNSSTKQKDKPVQMNIQRSDGYWVRGMIDFSIRLPINKLVGCNAKCEALHYTDPKPTEAGRHPFNADW
ncbi:hypothetical protein F4677DRAFT_448312 [Hypoxylon crocopeplum]|nr:hypothetical protein F4677DRAFT_448312 [Hypoxylon crocopeplum]